MPFYDIVRSLTTNGSAGTYNTHFAFATVANQETVQFTGIYAAGRFGTAGGAQFRLQSNAGTKYSGGAAGVLTPRNLRVAPTALTSAVTDASAITSGTSGITRVTVGFAQTGGMGGYVPIVPGAAVQMMANGTNPIDVEFSSVATSASVTFDATVEIAEGISA